MTVLIKKSAFITLELFLGFWFGVLGAVFVAPLFDGFVRATSPPTMFGCASGPMEGDLFFMNLTLYLFMLLGVIVAGYFHLRTFDRLNEFRSAIGWSFIGFLFFVFLGGIIQVLTYAFLPEQNNLVNLSIILPIFGIVIGFNFPAEE